MGEVVRARRARARRLARRDARSSPSARATRCAGTRGSSTSPTTRRSARTACATSTSRCRRCASLDLPLDDEARHRDRRRRVRVRLLPARAQQPRGGEHAIVDHEMIAYVNDLLAQRRLPAAVEAGARPRHRGGLGGHRRPPARRRPLRAQPPAHPRRVRGGAPPLTTWFSRAAPGTPRRCRRAPRRRPGW